LDVRFDQLARVDAKTLSLEKSNMSLKQILLAFLAAAHMTLIVAGALHVKCFASPTINEVNAHYGFMTGSGNSYGFFCSVPNYLRPRFIIHDAVGHTSEDALWQGVTNHEATLRFENCVSWFGNMNFDQRTNLGRTWAATILGRHPDAVKVDVSVEMYAVPSMVELKSGKQPSWVEIYSATFNRVSKQVN
jgi:hypothetical protein